MSSVTSPPSSTTSCGPLPPGNVTASSVQSQYSSSDSPFHANTGVPVAAMAAAAWSWVEKMLHEAQRTSAPRSLSVSISTAVWIVMCSEPVTRTPLQRLVRRRTSCGWTSGRHLVLGDVDFLAAPVGERDVGDLEILGVGVSWRACSWRCAPFRSPRWTRVKRAPLQENHAEPDSGTARLLAAPGLAAPLGRAAAFYRFLAMKG